MNARACMMNAGGPCRRVPLPIVMHDHCLRGEVLRVRDRALIPALALALSLPLPLPLPLAVPLPLPPPLPLPLAVVSTLTHALKRGKSTQCKRGCLYDIVKDPEERLGLGLGLS